MKRSSERILTTHVGSLPRPPDLLAMIQAKEQGMAFDAGAFAARVKSAVADVVKKQAESGIDIVADGEMGRVGFIPYVNERLTGIEPSPGEIASYWNESREYKAFPEFYAWAQGQAGAAGKAGRTRWMCTGPVAYKGHAALAADIANLKSAMVGLNVAEAFMPAVSPGNLVNWNRNLFYKSEEEYLYAVAEALREEYQAVIDAGLILQIDDPLLSSYYVMHPEVSLAGWREWAGTRVAAL
ncbi:MAG TPA: hypothetical protein VNV18_05565, partial [Stellaceae bacterium]|nr:hypothetical protein [Stellaceae bacterium]